MSHDCPGGIVEQLSDTDLVAALVDIGCLRELIFLSGIPYIGDRMLSVKRSMTLACRIFRPRSVWNELLRDGWTNAGSDGMRFCVLISTSATSGGCAGVACLRAATTRITANEFAG